MPLTGVQGSLLPEVDPYLLWNGDLSDLPDFDPLEQDIPESPPDAIAYLEQRREELLQSELAPALAWLERAQCHKRKSYQWFWRSEKPVFKGKKRRYIGMDGSSKVAAAKQSLLRRRELDWVERQLASLEAAHADGP